MNNLDRLRQFILSFTRLIDRTGQDEAVIFSDGKKLLSELVSQDDWLPDEFARPDPVTYQQYLLFCDPTERFCLVSFVWGPGQTTPIHDHTVWGMVGVLRGAEACEEYAPDPATNGLRLIGTHLLTCGSVDLVSPRVGDIHKVSNALQDQTSVSIHVYGANIGAVKRHVYDPDTGERKAFVSGYSSDVIPDIQWPPSGKSVGSPTSGRGPGRVAAR